MPLSAQRSIRSNLLAVATVAALSAVCAAPAFAGQADVRGLRGGGEYDQFIVKYRDGSSTRTSANAMASSLTVAADAIAPRQGKRLGLKHLRRMALGADVVRSDRKLGRAEAEALMRKLASDPNVEYVEPDLMMHALSVPNDPMFAQQWHYANSAVGINAPTAWDTTTGTGAVVAVIDSGILAHADLNGNLLPGYDMVSSTSGGLCGDFTFGCGASDDGDGRDADPNDASNVVHGTHVAGTVAAVGNNGVGVTGVAYGAKVVPVRVLGRKGSGTTSDILDAITWASGGSVSGVPANANPAEVINLSLGGPTACSAATQAAIDAAVARGTVIIAAAGNFNNDVSKNNPAGCNNVISVAAADRGGRRAYYSTWGASIDVTAPGGEVCTPATEFLPLNESPSGKCTAERFPENGVLSTIDGNNYASMPWQGTSMAAPHVAGIAALIQAAASSPRTPAQIEQILESTARPIAAADCPGGCGAGLVDAAAAVAAVGGGTPGNQAPVANFSSSVSGLTASFTDSSSDSDGTIASRSWNFGDGTSSTATNPSKTYTAAGTYTVTLTVTDNGGATNAKTASVVVGGSGGVQTYSNTTDYPIADNATVDSPITVSGRSGNAPSNAVVTVAIVHTYQGDLKVDLVAPDGSLYNIHNRTGWSTDNVNKTVTFNLSSEPLNGTWKLRVNDNAANDTGKIDSWSVKF
ncbi:S8 family serine peptidase [Lysobacter sp. CCNWLW3]|uniref:S8 family serine peptidase n=1 Tax=unclassified Lysobacter TaxID=2635362 RepID=UPI002FCFD965